MPSQDSPRSRPRAHLHQCHETPAVWGAFERRNAAYVTPFLEMMPDGLESTSNPRIQNFPHTKTTTTMLDEAGTTRRSPTILSLNCHPPAQLP